MSLRALWRAIVVELRVRRFMRDSERATRQTAEYDERNRQHGHPTYRYEPPTGPLANDTSWIEPEEKP